MFNARAGISLGLLGLLALRCSSLPDTVNINLVAPTQEDVGQIVKATFEAMTVQAGGKTASTAVPPASATGSISGSLNYPADSLPPLYVTAYQAGTQNYRFVITNAGQQEFQIDGLAPGTYHVIAYTVGGGGFPQGLAGGYTNAVPCGLSTSCTDHTLLDVSVVAGKTTTGVNPADWYAPPGTFPSFAGQATPPASAATAASSAAPPPSGANGAIAGNLMYPASGIPALRIVAFRVGGPEYFYVETAVGQSSYKIEQVPAGTYHVVAYVLPGGGFSGGLTGGFSQMVPCGLQAGCNDHSLIDVVVTPGGTSANVNPNDYYAGPGAFPPDPVP